MEDGKGERRGEGKEGGGRRVRPEGKAKHRGVARL